MGGDERTASVRGRAADQGWRAHWIWGMAAPGGPGALAGGALGQTCRGGRSAARAGPSVTS